jgi:hypothetical protein
MILRAATRCVVGLVGLMLVGPACKPASDKKDVATAPAQEAASEPALSDRDGLTAEERAAVKAALAEKDDDEPLFPLNGPEHPDAVKLCHVLQEVPARRTAECCKSPPPTEVLPHRECVRMLSAALHAGAVRVTAESVAACVEAAGRPNGDCAWAGAEQVPPPACLIALEGTLKAGARCRSTLECAGTLFCNGVSPTTAGTCSAPLALGGQCGAVDPLAAYTRNHTLETTRPACASGSCQRGRCVATPVLGAPCKYNGACATGHWCKAGACTDQPRGALGEACGAPGECLDALRCVGEKCALPNALGAPCTTNAQCPFRCEKDERGVGTCQPFCGIRAQDLLRIGRGQQP